MKIKGVQGTFLFFAIAVLAMSPFVFAGFGEWFGKITGWASSDSAAINVTLGNNAPTIPWVEGISGQTITESGNTVVYIAFNVTDIDLVTTLNDSSATMNFSLYGGSSERINTSCVKTTDFNTTMRQYNCTVSLAYFDPNGIWNVTASIRDNNGAQGTNNTLFFTLAQGIHINLTQSSASWAGITTSSQNIGSDTNPLIINNTGNANNKSLYITGYDLIGETISTQRINASDFSAGSSAPGCDNAVLVNASSVNITDVWVNRWNGGGGLTNLYLCIENVSSSLSSQSYSSEVYGNWVFEAS
jgi:hypothetical protein